MTYNPSVFDVADEAAARRIILTREQEQDSETRWARETPYLTNLIGSLLRPTPGAVLVDYGCGIGRLAKTLIERFDCKVIGVDISADMRRLAVDYVGSSNFGARSPAELDAAVRRYGRRASGAYSVWVLQHCLRPSDDIARIGSALAAGSPFVVVNNRGRAIPVKERHWVNDGLDIRAELTSRFDVAAEGVLEPTVVGEWISQNSFWGCYRQRSEGQS